MNVIQTRPPNSRRRRFVGLTPGVGLALAGLVVTSACSSRTEHTPASVADVSSPANPDAPDSAALLRAGDDVLTDFPDVASGASEVDPVTPSGAFSTAADLPPTERIAAAPEVTQKVGIDSWQILSVEGFSTDAQVRMDGFRKNVRVVSFGAALIDSAPGSSNLHSTGGLHVELSVAFDKKTAHFARVNDDDGNEATTTPLAKNFASVLQLLMLEAKRVYTDKLRATNTPPIATASFDVSGVLRANTISGVGAPLLCDAVFWGFALDLVVTGLSCSAGIFLTGPVACGVALGIDVAGTTGVGSACLTTSNAGSGAATQGSASPAGPAQGQKDTASTVSNLPQPGRFTLKPPPREGGMARFNCLPGHCYADDACLQLLEWQTNDGRTVPVVSTDWGGYGCPNGTNPSGVKAQGYCQDPETCIRLP